ncbi:putative BAG family molecular chaperone regulator 2 [Iris pallida]|uniref:BAG family molecular chaperone regulator 2 n=1 Tax=Iris pallida TaxID=29817 RepID=A0AAX6EUC3_IRIPA|nr:putative BAG family molecular chaperone regulator 2 [Iris pallida]
MMRMRTMARSSTSTTTTTMKENIATLAKRAAEEEVWEVRPCGMLVQKRDPDTEPAAAAAAAPVPTIRVRVKYESACYEIYVSSQASFGDLKKLVAEQTGLHPQDQKIVFKDRERDSREYLDTAGVKDRAKLALSADPVAHARRVLEMRRAAKAEKAAKSVSAVGSEVDKLSAKVSALETIVSKGKKVADKDILDLTEQLMNLLLRLDGIVIEGDVKIQKGKQVRRVQKYVETLDVLKVKNAKIVTTLTNPHQQQQQQPPQSAVVTAREWEVFDSLFGPSTSSAESTATHHHHRLHCFLHTNPKV